MSATENPPPALIDPAHGRGYLKGFNATDAELHPSWITNQQAADFLLAVAPAFECPDPLIESIYWFRWWTLRKHLRPTPHGYVITEFLPRMPWGGPFNEISCPADLHFHEARWLRFPEALDGYGSHWFRHGGRPRLYTFPAAHAIHARYLVTGDPTQGLDLLPDLVENFEAWERDHLDPIGLFWQTDVGDGGEESLGGHGYRTGINGAMYGDALGIAAFATIAGDQPLAERFQAKAASLRQLVNQKLWDEEAQFFKVATRVSETPLASVGILEWRLNRDPELAKRARPSASHVSPDSSVSALNDGLEPTRSDDRAHPRLAFLPAKGERVWAQYEFDQPVEISSIQIFWHVQPPEIRLPRQWSLAWRRPDGSWEPARRLRMYHADVDRFVHVPIEPVTTSALRLEMLGAGIAEPPADGRLPLADARELHGYLPWYYRIAEAAQAVAWDQLTDPAGFLAPYGPTTVEQRHPGFVIDREGHPCQWNGPSWPFATSMTLAALANLLNGPPQPHASKEDFFATLRTYARSHQLRRDDGTTVPWIDENLDPFTGEWLTRSKLLRRGASPHERGKDYNHSTFCDLVITGLVGLRPRADEMVEVNPLLPADAWDWFCLEGVPYHGRKLSIIYDRDGSRYGRGSGLRILVDDVAIAVRPDLGPLIATLPAASSTASSKR
jgi:hypothetical protein